MALKSEAGGALGSFRNLGARNPRLLVGMRHIGQGCARELPDGQVYGSEQEEVFSAGGGICAADPARIL